MYKQSHQALFLYRVSLARYSEKCPPPTPPPPHQIYEALQLEENDILVPFK